LIVNSEVIETISITISSSLVENYLSDMANRLKLTTMEDKENIIKTKILPYFSILKVSDIDTLKIRKWQNELLSYRSEDGMPYSQTYLKTIHTARCRL
jgi:hypothetical protein